jgi:uncharacterized damage-inducible protein DinB
MADSPERLAGRLQSEGEKTVAFFQELTPAEWQVQIYETGTNWSVRQILAHFVSTERGFADLIDNILSGGAGSPDDFDIDRYNERHVAKLQPEQVDALIGQYRAARVENIRRVQTMQPADLERQGRHPFLGVVPLEEIVKLLYRHNQIHQRDIRRAISPDQP